MIPNTSWYVAMLKHVKNFKREHGDECQAEVTCTKCDSMYDVDECYIDEATQTVLCCNCRTSQLCAECGADLSSDPDEWNGSLDHPLCEECVDTSADDAFEREGDR